MGLAADCLGKEGSVALAVAIKKIRKQTNFPGKEIHNQDSVTSCTIREASLGRPYYHKHRSPEAKGTYLELQIMEHEA